HAERGVLALTSDQLDAGTGGPGELGATARPQFDCVDRGPDRNVAQRQVIARLDVGSLASFNFATLAQAVRSDDVSLLAVGEVQQRDARGAVRVILDVRDLGRSTAFVLRVQV